jgi:endonuclease/exonuclease/phosphatase family metal-dependent hydrolase
MLRILTFNINGPGTKYGDWPRRRPRIVQVIEQARPGICALQAACLPQADGVDQIQELAPLLPGYPHVAVASADPRAEGLRLASAFVSRVPIAEVRWWQLDRRPALEDRFDRVVLDGRFRIGEVDLHVLNAHFSWVEEQAVDNVRQTLDCARALRGPWILVGDLNMAEDSTALCQLRDAGWIDAWRHLRPAERGDTFEAHRPTKRIDYAWVPEDLAGSLHSIDIVADIVGEGGVRPSDHLGLVVELAVPG